MSFQNTEHDAWNIKIKDWQRGWGVTRPQYQSDFSSTKLLVYNDVIPCNEKAEFMQSERIAHKGVPHLKIYCKAPHCTYFITHQPFCTNNSHITCFITSKKQDHNFESRFKVQTANEWMKKTCLSFPWNV